VPRSCTVCTHESLEEIDKALVAGTPNRVIACQYNLSREAVRRHKDGHLPAKLVMAHAAEEVADADALLSQIKTFQDRTVAILDRAEEAGELRTALSAIREARGNLELLAKLVGLLDERPVVNLNMTPEWLQLQAVIVGALEPFPQARGSVLSALEAIDGG
jgi:hypothetical protein